MGLESVGIVLALEDTFAIEFPDRIARDARTVRDLENIVIRLRDDQLEGIVRDAVPEAEVREVVRGIVARELSIDEAFVSPEAELIRDLGMDA